MSDSISGSAVVSEKNKSLTLFVPRSFFLKCLFFVISRYFYCISRYQPAVYPTSHGLFLQRRNPFGASGKLTKPDTLHVLTPYTARYLLELSVGRACR